MTRDRAPGIPPGSMPDEPDTAFGPAIVDQLYEGVYFVDPARRIRSWNKGAEALTGYQASDVVGRFCRDNLLNHVDAIPGDTAVTVFKRADAALYRAKDGGRNRAEVDPP